MPSKRIIVALSGKGRSLRNLLAYEKRHKSFKICGVISSSRKSLGVEIAKDHGLSVYIEKFSNNSFASSELSIWAKDQKPDLIVLAGFLKVFPTCFKIPGKEKTFYQTINIHPSLLPKFSGKGMYGKKVHEAVLRSEEEKTGASIHFVTEVYDEGPLLAQMEVPVKEGDSPEILAERVFEGECELYPRVIEDLLEKKLPQERPLVLKFKPKESTDK